MDEEKFTELSLALGYPPCHRLDQSGRQKGHLHPCQALAVNSAAPSFSRAIDERGVQSGNCGIDSFKGRAHQLSSPLGPWLRTRRWSWNVLEPQTAFAWCTPIPTVTATNRGVPPKPEDSPFIDEWSRWMARMCIDLGKIQSKYDCVLGANLHPSLPVDRHILVKRIRIWVNADGFISPLDFRALKSFSHGPNSGTWNFVANAGDGRTVEIKVSATMPDGQNTTIFEFARPTEAAAPASNCQPRRMCA